MTTKVLIVNFGPDNVKVQPVSVQTGEPMGTSSTVYVQQSGEFYVHFGQKLEVEEMKKPATPEAHG